MNQNEIGGLIRQLRLAKGLTQLQLALRMNISDKTISKWERGLGCPDVSLLNKLASIFGVPVDQILDGKLQINEEDNRNMKKTSFYVCTSCQSMMTGSGGVSITCCGKRLNPLKANQTTEDHQVQVSLIDDDYYITLEHEMSKSHYIMFAAYITYDRMLLIKLYPEQNAEFRLPLMQKGELFLYCSQHGLIKQNKLPTRRELLSKEASMS